MTEKMPNADLRAAAEKAVSQWTTWDGLARDIGWARRGRGGDGTRLKRVLGVTHGRDGVQQNISLESAEKIVRALNLDPVDVGL